MKPLSHLWLVGALLFPVACKGKAAPPPPPPEVSVVPVVQKDVPVVSEWIGTLDGSVNADIRPKVEGYLLRQFYKKGALGQADAVLQKATRDVERFTPLAAERAISQQELDNALSAQRNAQALVASSRAAVEQSALNLAWTKVTSPIEGIVGIAKAQVGDLVNPQAVMTTVSTVDPIRVTYGISEREYLRFAETINRSNYATTEQGPVLDLILDDGQPYAQKGRAKMADREVDQKTGTMTIRGFFPNPGHILRPGQYGKVRSALTVKTGALLVPQRAVMELQGGYRVVVVGPDNKADIRVVEPSERSGDLWVIEKGLKAGESVVVSGIQYVRAGMTVKAKPFAAETAAATVAPGR
jgi:membrane fusion protein (multidrug efflux system)